MKTKFIPVIAALLMLFFVGPASAVSNTYTQNGTWDLRSNLSTSNVYDSSKISSMSINLTPSVQHVDPENISGLVGYYKFDESSGTVVANTVNASNNGTVSGAAIWNTTGGKYNGALALNTNNSSSGYITVNDPFLGATAFTFVCWMNSNYTLYQTPFIDYNNTAKNILLSSYAANSMRFYVGDGTNISTSLTNSNWTNDTWHMIVASFNATTGRMDLWVDRNKSTQATTISRIGSVQASGLSCTIGRNNQQYTTSQGFTNGSIDDVAFYNRSLTDAEIQSLYYSGLYGISLKSNANTNAAALPNATGGVVSIPHSVSDDDDITSLSAVVPSTVTADGVTIRDYSNTVSPVTYGLSITSSEEYTPVASFTHTPITGIKPVTVTFTDTSTNLPTSWNWNFGDGETSHSQNPTHEYDTAGTYTATLTASNGAGSSSANTMISVLPAAGDNGIINNSKRIAIYIENTETNPICHDTGFASMMHEYNITYLTNATIAGNLSAANFDLLVLASTSDTSGINYGVCSNSTAKYVNDYIASGGSVWFFSDPLNETNIYMTNMSNATWSLPANRFNCLGSIAQINITAGSTLTINNADTITSFLPGTISSLSTSARWTNVRNFGGVSGKNAYGYNYTALVYYNNDPTKCQVAKIWNDTTGARIVYSNPQSLVAGGDINYFNGTTGTKLFNNLKSWVLKLDENTMGVSITYPRGDKQVVCIYDDMSLESNVSETSYFDSQLAARPNNIGVTLFVIPEGRQNGSTTGSMTTGYNYYTGKGYDLDTVHPHLDNVANTTWGSNELSVSYMESLLGFYLNSYRNGISNDPNLEFCSIRFPGTRTNATSSQAAVNLGAKIASNYGQSTTMGSWRDSHTNMRPMQAEKILYGVKTGQLELEAPTSYDTSYAPGGAAEAEGVAGWIATCEAKVPSFMAINYPAIYQINGHRQWSMINNTWTDADMTILDYIDNQTAYTAYTNFATLADYEIAMQEAGIRVDTTGSTTTAVINAKYPIKDFTLKFANISNGISATLDGTTLAADHVVYEDGVYYVFCDIPVGRHTMVVRDIYVGSGATYIGKNGVASENISGGSFVKNNAATAHTTTIDTNNVYTNATNTLSGDENTLVVGAHKLAEQLPAQFLPEGGDIEVEVSAWNDSSKKWTENSDTHSATMTHYISGFQPNQYTALKVDGVVVGEYVTDDTGTIGFTYTGGYSEHEFEMDTADVSDFDVMIAPKSVTAMDDLKIIQINATGMSQTTHDSLVGAVVNTVTNGYVMGSIVILVLALLGVLKFFRGDI